MLRRFSRLSRPLAVALLAAWLPAHAQLPAPVMDVLRATNIPETAVSALVLRDDKTILSHLADHPMQPASTMKLVTTLVSLERLGPVFRGRTELRTAGEQHGDVLQGDLYLRGGADADFTTEALETMLRELRYQGIRKIQGHLVVDRELFNPARLDVGAPAFDESPDAYYNVIPDAAMVNKNLLQLYLSSTSGKLKLAMQPELQGVSIGADMKLVNGDCNNWGDGWKTPDILPQRGGGIKIMLHGTFPKNCVGTDAVNVIDRQAYLDRLFRASWKRLGGSISGDTTEGATPATTRLLAAHLARALPEVVRDTNKPSDNTLARLLFLSLGALESDPLLGSHPQAAATDTAAGATPTLARSEQVVRSWMREHGIDDTGLVLENGSGLSRTERITPIQMGGVLQAGLRSNWAPEFEASMPIVAVDGTMRHRLHDSPAAGRARMKTGTLRNVTAIAGYVPDASGRQCVVVAMVNSELVSNGQGRAVLDALVDWVARLNAPQLPGQPGPTVQPLQPEPAPALPAQPAAPVQPAPAVGGA